MRVVVVSGIYPPDIGGPATHAADVVGEFRERNHTVSVLSLCDGPQVVRDAELVRYPRRWPWPVRSLASWRWLVRNRHSYDVVYATGTDLAAVAGARAARKPIVLKVVADPAWERASRQGLTALSFEDFQRRPPRTLRVRSMCMVRDWMVRRATLTIAPSRHLAGYVDRWRGRAGERTTLVPNGVRAQAPIVARGADLPLRIVYVGRLIELKRVDILLEAIALIDGVTLEVIGDGPTREALEAAVRQLGITGRVVFRGALPHDAVIERLAVADALASASEHEGLPHVMLEAMVCGTPVVSAAPGGVSEVVADGLNGLLVQPPMAESFADAFRRLRDNGPLRQELRAGALSAGSQWRFDRCADHLEELLDRVTTQRPRAVFLGKSAFPAEPGPDLRHKLALHARRLRQTSVTTGRPGIRRVEGVRHVTFPALRPPLVGGLLFYTLGPVVALAAAAGRRSAIICQSPYEAVVTIALRRLLPRRIRPRVQVELHGDWRTAPRMYGSRGRQVVGPLADRACEWALRRADRVRAVSMLLEQRARDAGYRGPIDRHITFSDFRVFLAHPTTPSPQDPRVVFVGVLERYKAVDVLLDAWSAVVRRVPNAELVCVGEGSLGARLRRQAADHGLNGSVRFVAPMAREALTDLIDWSLCLVLPSRSEGLPRIVMEAMARGRAVVASTVGGMDELVEDQCTGRLVAPEDVGGLADALIEVLTDPERARAMGAEGRRRAEARDPIREYEEGIDRLAAWISTP